GCKPQHGGDERAMRAEQSAAYPRDGPNKMGGNALDQCSPGLGLLSILMAQTCERLLPVRSIQISPGEADGQEVLSLQRLSVLGEQNMNLHPPHRPGFFLRLEDRTTRDKPSVVVLEWLLPRGQSRTA